MKIFQAEDDAADKKFDYVLGKLLSSAYLESKVTSGHVIHDKIEIDSVLKCVDHIDKEGMFQLTEKSSLVHD